MSSLSKVMDRIYVKQVYPAIKAFNASRLAYQEGEARHQQVALDQIAMLELWAKESAAQAKELRKALVKDMDETGTLGLFSDKYEGGLSHPPRELMITDEKALHASRPDLFEPQPDKLNRAELTKALKKGERIDGATLSNGGAMRLVIRGKKGIAA
ncbi:siphovirus Gp157 family protein [Komagataeibacter saccharivorans]|uniref:siphovirus Gp157 family protein n=1 Tax=Komagataeibacter saccharivorans TaxID=265959 RepID=UPI000C85430E|nr:siphovirus Gp157 family protein [Komagataeibacter saccharivorans]